MQARAEALSDHEEELEAWKQKFKAEALRQIAEREKTLADWQTKLDRKKVDLEELQRSMEVLVMKPQTYQTSVSNCAEHALCSAALMHDQTPTMLQKQDAAAIQSKACTHFCV